MTRRTGAIVSGMHVAVEGAAAYAQAETGYVQPSAGTSPDRERQNGLATQLSFLFGANRALSVGLPATAALSRDASMSRVRTARPLHRGRGVIRCIDSGPRFG